MKKSGSKGLFAILFLIFAFFILFIVFGIFALKTLTSDKDLNGTFATGPKNASIGVIEVSGIILTSNDTIKLLIQAEKDETIKAIIVRIDSPGGAVGPTQEIYEEIRRIDKIKPVYASFGSIAASGGYYIGAGARQIYANAGTLTGSIGVIMQFMDISKLYEFAKIKPTIVKGGVYKDIGNPARGLTPEEMALMKELIDSVHSQFRRDIIKGRGDRLKGDITLHTQGQIFSGESAQQIGLVDHLGGLWSAGRAIHKDMKLPGEFDLKFFKTKKDFSFSEILNNVEESVTQLKDRVILNRVPLLLYER